MNRAFSPPARGDRCGKFPFSGLLRNHEVCLKISWFNLLTVPGLTPVPLIASVMFLGPSDVHACLRLDPIIAVRNLRCSGGSQLLSSRLAN